MKMKKFITIILSFIILSSAMAAETGQRILENNYEKNGIIELEKQKKSLEDNKNITNLQFVLSNSDLSKEDTFKAADFIALDETANARLILMLLIAIVLGFVLSCLFVLVRNSLRA